ncbi:hypothetical protein [Mucilaginibacter flavidus]|uniref:hypothetical protein n=1 Tax=Mucilaginibacter flavidus TaxID=2949309 RepID=UPI0020936F18|nr:hypothetical protein [Mucilaginibacter flavidus]MCO5950748.1 hypothetical protein [Mucilaginibacter flavidus]
MDCCKDTHLVANVKDAHKGGINTVCAIVFSVSPPAVVFAGNYYQQKPAYLAVILYKDLLDPPPGSIPVFLKNPMRRV